MSSLQHLPTTRSQIVLLRDRARRLLLFGGIGLLAALLGVGRGADVPSSSQSSPEYWKWAPTPPMGWNSYDAYGDSVTEQEFLANAQFVKDHLLAHGWNYVVVDYRWYDPAPNGTIPHGSRSADLCIDKFGRLLPSANRFPSAANGIGFKTIADKVHAMGLKFGIHVMRGIPCMAVKESLPIEGSQVNPWDVVGYPYVCRWCLDMLPVNGNSPGGQAYYDSLMRLYAQWGVDFVKIDDLSQPYSDGEIAAYRRAIDKCGRPMVFSTSPGETPVAEADDIMHHANMWRVSGDFWDNWRYLNHSFDLAYAWQKIAGPGHWPDQDMIPLAQLSVKNRSVGSERMSGFTHDELTTLLSLWALAPSPLMLGGNLTAADDGTLSLITNDEVLAIDQDPLGKGAVRIAKSGTTEVWAKELHDGSTAIGLFNRGESTADVSVKWSDANRSGKQSVRNLWTHQDLGTLDDGFSSRIPAHGAVLLKIATTKS